MTWKPANQASWPSAISTGSMAGAVSPASPADEMSIPALPDEVVDRRLDLGLVDGPVDRRGRRCRAAARSDDDGEGPGEHRGEQ